VNTLEERILLVVGSFADVFPADVHKTGERSSCISRATECIILRPECVTKELEHRVDPFWGTTQPDIYDKTKVLINGYQRPGQNKVLEEQPAKQVYPKKEFPYSRLGQPA